MKDDIPPAPDVVPKKRRAIHDAPALWLRTWLERSETSPRDRKRVQEEIDRRKKEVRPLRVGVVIGKEGLTPEQVLTFVEVLGKVAATEVHHPWLTGKLHAICARKGVPVIVHSEGRTFTSQASEVVKAADLVIAAPKEQTEPVQKVTASVWGMIKYAKHRNTPVIIIDPGGHVV